MFDLVIKNGLIVGPEGTVQADIAISGGRIEQVGSANLFGKTKRSIDATGKYILPGLIDVHTHIESPIGGCQGILDFYAGSAAAAFGGVTTVIDFSNTVPGQSVLKSVEARLEEMAKAAIDYGLHAEIIDSRPETLEEIGPLVELGCSSFKFYMTYKNDGIMISDEGMLHAFGQINRFGGLPIVHAESNAIAEFNEEKFKSAGTLDWVYHGLAKPPICEQEAVERALLLARFIGVPLFIFHLSSRLGLESLAAAQAYGQQVYAETCPHYLILDEEKYAGEDGHLFIMSPPLRGSADREALWQGIQQGNVAVVSSDNCTFARAEKEAFLQKDDKGKVVPDYTKVPNGVTGLEERLLLLLTEGVSKGRITLNKLCEIACYNPARIFGMYPRKGAVQKGSDADLVIIDLEKSGVITPETLHYGLDYSIYDGKAVQGWPIMTIAHGRVIVEEGQFTGQRGAGRFIRRNRSLV